MTIYFILRWSCRTYWGIRYPHTAPHSVTTRYGTLWRQILGRNNYVIPKWSNLTLLWAHLLSFEFLVNFDQGAWLLTLTHVTFDLDILNLVALSQTVLEIWFFSSLNFCHRQTTDRKRRIWAHRAWAQVGSKIGPLASRLIISDSNYVLKTWYSPLCCFILYPPIDFGIVQMPRLKVIGTMTPAWEAVIAGHTET